MRAMTFVLTFILVNNLSVALSRSGEKVLPNRKRVILDLLFPVEVVTKSGRSVRPSARKWRATDCRTNDGPALSQSDLAAGR